MSVHVIWSSEDRNSSIPRHPRRSRMACKASLEAPRHRFTMCEMLIPMRFVADSSRWITEKSNQVAKKFHQKYQKSNHHHLKKCGDQKLGISSRDSCSCIIITLWQSPWCCKQPLVFGRCKFWIHKNERWLAPPKSIRLSIWLFEGDNVHSMDALGFAFFAWIPRCSTVQSS